jgi:hypothetical protein
MKTTTPTIKPNLPAFRRLVKILNSKKVKAKKGFYLGSWGVEGACGTIACACGWATLDPWFKARGFHSSSGDAKGYPLVPTFGTYADGSPRIGFSAVAAFFHISYEQTIHLFSAHEYARGNLFDVLRRVTAFINKHS